MTQIRHHQHYSNFLHSHQAISNKWVIIPECIYVNHNVIPKVKVKRKWPPTILESSSMQSPRTTAQA